MERGLFDTSIEILQTINRDKAVSMANRARQRGFKVECVSDGWNVYHVRISHIDRSEAFPVCWKEFSDKAEAAKWILEYQSSRRNITDGQKYVASESVQKIIREQARAAQLTNLKKGDASPVLENSPKRDKPINTRKEVAKAAENLWENSPKSNPIRTASKTGGFLVKSWSEQIPQEGGDDT